MTCNTWTFTGEILSFNEKRGKKGSEPASWGRAWIRMRLDLVKNTAGAHISNNVIFLHVPTEYGNTRKAKATESLIKSLKVGDFALVKEAKVGKIKRWIQKDDGSFQEHFETGIRAAPDQISVKSTRYSAFNSGMVAGKVSKQGGSTIIVEEPYPIPNKKSTGIREIPLVLGNNYHSMKGSYIIATAELSGVGPKGNYAICGYVKELVIE